jgi:hypothetical protein
MLKMAMSDGSLKENEAKMLQASRKKLGITQASHDELVGAIVAASPPPTNRPVLSFDALDTNKDGVIDQEEFAAAKSKLQEEI